jgi:NAD-dependent deacetylase
MKLSQLYPMNITPNLRVTFLTGAGISAESGVPTFRGKGSMWKLPEARRLAQQAGPPWNTKETWEYYEWRRKLVAQCNPNAAHKTIAAMESYFQDFTLITQNVDGLHFRAGSKNVLELHGNMWRGRCSKDGDIVDLPRTPIEKLPPYHFCGTAFRPHVVQFGESLEPAVLQKAFNASINTDLFIAVGTSAVVSPASHMPRMALENDASVLEINIESTPLTPFVTGSLRGKASDLIPKLWKTLKQKM